MGSLKCDHVKRLMTFATDFTTVFKFSDVFNFFQDIVKSLANVVLNFLMSFYIFKYCDIIELVWRKPCYRIQTKHLEIFQ